MLAYLDTPECRLVYLRRQLDDDTEQPCGRCDTCTGTVWSPSVDADTEAAAQQRISRPGVALPPRKQWPSGMAELGVPASGRIPAGELADEGRVIGRLSDIGWGTRLRELVSGDDVPVPPDVLDACVTVLAGWSWAARPVGVVGVGSRTRPHQLAHLARRISEIGRLPLLGTAAPLGPRPGAVGELRAAAGGGVGRVHRSRPRRSATARCCWSTTWSTAAGRPRWSPACCAGPVLSRAPASRWRWTHDAGRPGHEGAERRAPRADPGRAAPVRARGARHAGARAHHGRAAQRSPAVGDAHLAVRDGEAIVVVASRGGDDRHPDWLLNLRAQPRVEVALRNGPRRPMVARVADGAERERLWTEITTFHPRYAAYQRRTTREIPVVLLLRRPTGRTTGSAGWARRVLFSALLRTGAPAPGSAPAPRRSHRPAPTASSPAGTTVSRRSSGVGRPASTQAAAAARSRSARASPAGPKARTRTGHGPRDAGSAAGSRTTTARPGPAGVSSTMPMLAARPRTGSSSAGRPSGSGSSGSTGPARSRHAPGSRQRQPHPEPVPEVRRAQRLRHVPRRTGSGQRRTPDRLRPGPPVGRQHGHAADRRPRLGRRAHAPQPDEGAPVDRRAAQHAVVAEVERHRQLACPAARAAAATGRRGRAARPTRGGRRRCRP